MPFLVAFWKPIAAIVAVLALLATVAVIKHRYDEARRDEGRAEVRAELAPKLAAAEARAANAEAANVELAANLATLQTTLAEQARAVARLKADTLAAQRATRAAIAKAEAKVAAYAVQVDRLSALAALPRATPLPPDQDAAAADTIMRDVMRGLVAEQMP